MLPILSLEVFSKSFFFVEEIKYGSIFHKYKFNRKARGHRRFLFCRKCTHANVMYFVAVSTSKYHVEDKTACANAAYPPC